MAVPEIATTSYSDADILRYLLDSGTIGSIDNVAAQMREAERKKLLVRHPYALTQGKDGRWRSYVLLSDGKRKQIAKSSKADLENAIIDFYTQSESNGEKEKSTGAALTLESLYPKFREYKILHAASSTYVMRLDSDWKNHYLSDPIVRKDITTLTKLDLDLWSHTLIKKLNGAKKQYYNISLIMRQMLDLAVDMQIIRENPLRLVKIEGRMVFKPKKKKASATQVFAKEEVRALFQAAGNDFAAGYNRIHKLAPLAVQFQFLSGVRLGELCALRYEDVTEDEIYVSRMFRFETKEMVDYLKAHREGRYIPLTSEAKAILQTAKNYQEEHALPTDGYIFSVNAEPLSYYAVRKLYDRYCDMIGTIHKSTHSARKTYVSALIDGGVNIDSIREIVGHADERTTYNCYCYDRSTKKEKINLIEQALSS